MLGPGVPLSPQTQQTPCLHTPNLLHCPQPPTAYAPGQVLFYQDPNTLQFVPLLFNQPNVPQTLPITNYSPQYVTYPEFDQQQMYIPPSTTLVEDCCSESGSDTSRESLQVVDVKAKEKSVERPHSQKFAFRSKQNKINEVYDALVRKYSKLRTLLSDDQVLRGPSVIRLHVKKYDALCQIEDALNAVEECPELIVTTVSIPMSMKNPNQKKGFLVYFKLLSTKMVPQAQRILRTFPEFRKCDVAVKKR